MQLLKYIVEYGLIYFNHTQLFVFINKYITTGDRVYKKSYVNL
ncbi:hypothetical protein JOC70_001146 [Clostridium pascui]|nr:hypothetical protein [Clostridium pascui]